MNSINNTESAGQIGYNNTTSGLTATDVQGAVDEVVERFNGLKIYKKEISVTFSKSIYAGPFNISTETGRVVTANNIKNIVLTGVGVTMYPVLSSNKAQFYIYSNEAQNLTAPGECILLYT